MVTRVQIAGGFLYVCLSAVSLSVIFFGLRAISRSSRFERLAHRNQAHLADPTRSHLFPLREHNGPLYHLI